MDACRYIKKVWKLHNAINVLKGLFDVHFMALQSLNDKTSGCNSQMGYKMKLLKHGGAGQ